MALYSLKKFESQIISVNEKGSGEALGLVVLLSQKPEGVKYLDKLRYMLVLHHNVTFT